jgi:flagellar basal-body rod protein FlgC
MSASAFDIAASGMAVHRAEMDVIAQNIANAGTSRVEDGAPYRERRAVIEPAEQDSFASIFDDAMAMDGDGAAPAGVRLAGIVESAEPDVDPIEQMVSLVSTGRAYDADVAALQAAKQMEVEAIGVDSP